MATSLNYNCLYQPKTTFLDHLPQLTITFLAHPPRSPLSITSINWQLPLSIIIASLGHLPQKQSPLNYLPRSPPSITSRITSQIASWIASLDHLHQLTITSLNYLPQLRLPPSIAVVFFTYGCLLHLRSSSSTVVVSINYGCLHNCLHRLPPSVASIDCLPCLLVYSCLLRLMLSQLTTSFLPPSIPYLDYDCPLDYNYLP